MTVVERGGTRATVTASPFDTRDPAAFIDVAVTSQGRTKSWRFNKVWLDPEETGVPVAEIFTAGDRDFLFVHTYSGGARCCWSVLVFDLRELKSLRTQVSSASPIELVRGSSGCEVGANVIPTSSKLSHPAQGSFHCFDGKKLAKRAGPATELCHVIAERYGAWRKRVEAHGTAAPGRGPLALKDVKDSGVKIDGPLAELTGESELVEWARASDPPFEFPPGLLPNFSPWYRIAVDKLPGAEFYAASTVQGTAHCISAVYFTVAGGHAREAAGPTSWSDGDDTSGCGVRRAFGTVDGVPVAFEEAPGATMLEGSLILSPWRRGRFGPACSLVVRFSPRFSLTDAWKQECVGSRCASLRATAMALVADVQADPRDALRSALSKLSPEQRSAFLAREAQQPSSAGKSRGSDIPDPDQLTDQAPLVLPFVVEGVLYRVAVGHITIGWRHSPDWRVTFEDLSGEGPAASLAIGMVWGELLDASVR